MGDGAAFEDGDVEPACMATDRATAAKAAGVGWDRGLRDASDKGAAEKFPR